MLDQWKTMLTAVLTMAATIGAANGILIDPESVVEAVSAIVVIGNGAVVWFRHLGNLRENRLRDENQHLRTTVARAK